VSGIYNPLISIRTKNLSFRPQFVVQTTQRIATFVLSIALALALRDYWALVWGQLLAVVLTAIVSYWIAPYRPTFRLNEARSLVKFSVWLSLGELVNMFGWRFDQLIIGYFLPRAQLGLYFVADNIASVPTREPILPITQTLFPGFANLRGDPARLARAFSLAQATITAVTFPMGFGFAVVSAPLVHLLLGEKWLGAIPILQVLSGLYAFNSLTATMQSLAIASNQPRGLLLRNIRGVLLRAPAVLLGLWYDGLMGIVWARVVCSIIGTVLNMGYAGRLAGISLSAQIKLHWRTFAATIIMLAVTIPLNLVFGGQTEVKWLVAQTASVVAAGAVAYTASIWVLWLVSGKPEGPEAEGARLLRRLARRGATRTKTG
jgi:O-antigen/teichoic acid export membrane protein